ncbi:MAG: HNH endonuclease [Spirulina sp.]
MSKSTIKDIVAERANWCCEYCQSQLRYSPDPFSVEHIIPVIRGGTNDLDNLALSCQGCNNRKYTSITARDLVNRLTNILRTSKHKKYICLRFAFLLIKKSHFDFLFPLQYL